MYKSLDSDVEGASICAYVVSYSDKNYKFFLENEISDKKRLDTVINFIEKNQHEEIVVIKNLNVEEIFRGQGLGRDLLENAISNGSIALLVADNSEEQIKDFYLERFYEGSDFLTVSQESSGPLMVYPGDIAEELKESLNALIKPAKPRVK